MSPVEFTRDRLESAGVLGTAERLAKEYRCTLADLMGRSRMKGPAAARRHFWAILRDSLDLSYPEIAKLFGANHTTILTGVRKAHARLAKEHAA